ncbi:hypothetical protein [Spiroplasma endosymbiont of Virgichneumon dumeticola]|uniref:hypothetical protein n=1 Tax=Spiroplasma endosymbiont of Virgichneumon dumeticola TaxID=3139323 RepID=UPI0035C93D6E
MVGNSYDSYLELGQTNWKLNVQFDDKDLNDKANKLNVTVDSHSAIQEVKQEANGWLDNYKNTVNIIFNNNVNFNGKGFNIVPDDLADGFKTFLDHVNYVDSSTKEAINQSKLDTEIDTIANQKLQDGLSGLPQDLNVDTRNIINKSTLDSYTSWINGYQKFITDNKDQWINQIIAIASRGFASSEQIQLIQQHINQVGIKSYLKPITWTSNTFNYLKSSTIDDDYLNLV